MIKIESMTPNCVAYRQGTTDQLFVGQLLPPSCGYEIIVEEGSLMYSLNELELITVLAGKLEVNSAPNLQDSLFSEEINNATNSPCSLVSEDVFINSDVKTSLVSEDVKVEPAKVEPAKVEPAKVEPAKKPAAKK